MPNNYQKSKPAGNRPSLDDYIDVAERIQDFIEQHPDGSLQTIGWEVVTVEGFDAKTKQDVKRTFVVYRAEAYRNPSDPKPGQGIAWEPFPGQTPYTANSELMNAETAAWGRAIIALGLAANKGLASRQEVRNRQAEQEDSKPSEAPQAVADEPTEVVSTEPTISDEFLDRLRKEAKAHGVTQDQMKFALVEAGVDLDPNDKNALKDAMSHLTMANLIALCDTLSLSIEAITGTTKA